MSLMKKSMQKVAVIMIIALAFCAVGMPTSKAYAASYAKSLTKTVTLEPGETVTWILASKGKGAVPLTYEVISLDGVKKGETVSINYVDDYDEYSHVVTLEEGHKETLGAYAIKSSTFGTFAYVGNFTSGTIEIKLRFKVKSGKKILKTKEYRIE